MLLKHAYLGAQSVKWCKGEVACAIAVGEGPELWGDVGCKEGLEKYEMLDEGVRVDEIPTTRTDGCRDKVYIEISSRGQ